MADESVTDVTTVKTTVGEDAGKNDYYKTTLRYGLGLVGAVGGILLAVHRKSGFWGGVGWWFVGSMAGGATGFVIGSIVDGKPK